MAVESPSVSHLEKHQFIIGPTLTRYSWLWQNVFDVGGRGFFPAGKLWPSATCTNSLLLLCKEPGRSRAHRSRRNNAKHSEAINNQPWIQTKGTRQNPERI